MHDERVNIMVANAFNGVGDATGEDDFGTSVAWLDLDDYVEAYGSTDVPEGCYDDSDALSAWLKTWQDVNGARYVLAYINADGSRYAIGYESHADMMQAYREHENAYLKWLDGDMFR